MVAHNEFSKLLSRYLSDYLPNRKNASNNTISSYCDTFKLFLTYCRNIEDLKIERMKFKDLTYERINGFLDWLIKDKNYSASSVNQRLAAIKSFLKYSQIELPSHVYDIERLISIEKKKTAVTIPNFLSIEIIRTLLSQPNQLTTNGRRDIAMLSLLYDSGARVQELVDLSIKDIRLAWPAKVRLYGKGRKTRDVPLMNQTTAVMRDYLAEQENERLTADGEPLFCNRVGKRLTRAGVSHLLNKYYQKTKNHIPCSLEKISPHVLRHSKAMHLLQAGINIFYIKDLLGHADVSTTEIYAHADIEMKRKALESIETSPIPASVPPWAKDKNLLDWLNDFSKESCRDSL